MFRVLIDDRFMEGWRKGDVVAMDDIASEVPLKEGAIELFVEKKEEPPVVVEELPVSPVISEPVEEPKIQVPQVVEKTVVKKAKSLWGIIKAKKK
jgi:hypothetical protein